MYNVTAVRFFGMGGENVDAVTTSTSLDGIKWTVQNSFASADYDYNNRMRVGVVVPVSGESGAARYLRFQMRATLVHNKIGMREIQVYGLPMQGSGSCPNACSGHGSCNASAACECSDGFWGEDCAFPVCSGGCGSGVCGGDGACVCAAGTYGAACELQTSCLNGCMGDGPCAQSVGGCECSTEYWREDCGLCQNRQLLGPSRWPPAHIRNANGGCRRVHSCLRFLTPRLKGVRCPASATSAHVLQWRPRGGRVYMCASCVTRRTGSRL